MTFTGFLFFVLLIVAIIAAWVIIVFIATGIYVYIDDNFDLSIDGMIDLYYNNFGYFSPMREL